MPSAVSTDQVEVLIYHQEGGPKLAGAAELVSPTNKDRPAARDAFVAKCVALLSQAIGVLPLPGGLCLQLDLKISYARTWTEQRVIPNGV